MTIFNSFLYVYQAGYDSFHSTSWTQIPPRLPRFTSAGMTLRARKVGWCCIEHWAVLQADRVFECDMNLCNVFDDCYHLL